jgi:hypothetical protein
MPHGEQPAALTSCQHGLFSGLKCLYWQREWGDVPKAITEATAVVVSKPQSRPKPKPQAPAKKEANFERNEACQ